MRECKHCNGPIIGRNKKAIFCSRTCNNRHNKPLAPSTSPLNIRKTAVKYKYGIEWEELEKLHDEASGRCEICRTPIDLVNGDKTTTVHVDHSHVTGKVRGVLCLQCNVGIGAFKDNPALLEAAIKYLEVKNADG